MNTAPDLFPGQKRYRPETLSEYIEDFNYRYSTYAYQRHLDQQECLHDAEIFIPNQQHEEMLSAIELDLASWGGDYSKRRKIEKKTARYIREKVVPRKIMLEAESIADRLESCRNSGVLGVELNSGRKVIRWAEKCGLVKLCPDEARADQKRLARQYVPAADAWITEKLEKDPRRKWKDTFQYAVFSPVNVPIGELREGIKDAFKNLRDLLRHASFRNVAGCFAALECPLSSDGRSWNVHINCLFLVDGHFDWKRVRTEYGQRIHFESTQSIIDKTLKHLQRRNGGQPIEATRKDVLICAFKEIIKYSAKHVSSKSESGKTDAPGITEWPPELFAEWYAAHKGLRRCRSYGVLYGIDKPEREPYEVQWIGDMQFCAESRVYIFKLNKRPPIISVQGDKSTENRARNPKQTSFFQPGAPPG